MRGQITLEVIIAIGILFIIFIASSLSVAFYSERSMRGMAKVADLRHTIDTVVSASNNIIIVGEKRTLKVYIPSLTNITTNGDTITGSTRVRRQNGEGYETYSITGDLYGKGWRLYNETAPNSITEPNGSFYEVNISWENYGRVIRWRRV